MNHHFLHSLLAQSARHNPDQTAIWSDSGCLSYAELEATSNQLAHTLQAAGIKQGDRMGIYLDKSPAAIIALFAIMKAGAAYIPLDPDAPSRRIEFIIENSGMAGLVTDSAKLSSLDMASLTVTILTDDVLTTEAARISWSQVLEASAESLPVPEALEQTDLAYILYTSGSTGYPKGVMISHRAALSFVNWATEYFSLESTDCLSNHAPLHFDLSTFDIFAGIKAGAKVCLVPPSLAIFPASIADFIEQQEISVWYSVPSALTRLVLYGGLKERSFLKLREILFAGEVFPIKYLRELKKQLPNKVGYHNLYGPTETNVCNVYTVSEIPEDQVEPLSIGQACAGCKLFVLNEHNALAGEHEPGELCVYGPSVMSGYLGLQEQTKAAFIPHPQNRSILAYRTGDLVKMDANGDYHFIGRRDTMVKSRGYRIELGEIETVLQNHPEVEEAVVVPVPDDELGNILKAIVVSAAPSEELIALCTKRLPKYMVPDQFVFYPALPKTSTGKIDRVKLAASVTPET